MIRILVVDDDRAVASSIAMSLEYEGFSVVTAASGNAGIAAVEEAGVDLAIVDIFMPGSDGLETIAAMRQRQPDLPIIAFSGFAPRHAARPAADKLAAAIDLGAARALEKPIRRREIVDAVYSCLGEGAAA